MDVKKRRQIALNFVIDKLTNSIENIQTGDVFPTSITLLTTADLKSVTKKHGWQFDWKYELKQPEREVYKLTIPNNISIIQGLISLEFKTDHIYMHLVESVPFNKVKQKFTPVYLETLLLLPAVFHFKEALKGMFLSSLKRN